MKINPIVIIWSLALFFLAALVIFFNVSGKPMEHEKPQELMKIDTLFHIPLVHLKAENFEVERNQFLADLFTSNGFSKEEAYEFSNHCDSVFSPSSLRAGATYHVIHTDDSLAKPVYLIYEMNKLDYVVFGKKQDSLFVEAHKIPSHKVHSRSGGTITHSLWGTLDRNHLNPELAVELSEVFKWSINFYKIQKNDRFKVVYDEVKAGDESIDVTNIDAVLFTHKGKDYYAIALRDDNGKLIGYYDKDGKSLKQMFLQAPVKFLRISSRYSMNRFHPVQKRNKPHLGTDYAAPTGTPIYATADGVVIAAAYTRGNGNYVKIQHDKTYTTQYLHMSKIAKGMKKGVHVEQGQVIGYVGSTGLATGPHVCYRFWKNGQQVDPYKEIGNAFAKPLSKEEMQRFQTQSKPLLAELDSVSFENLPLADTLAVWFPLEPIQLISENE